VLGILLQNWNAHKYVKNFLIKYKFSKEKKEIFLFNKRKEKLIIKKGMKYYTKTGNK